MQDLPVREGNIWLIILALVPAIVLCVLILIKDKTEKKPVGLLLRLFVFGAVSCFLAALFEEYGEMILNQQYADVTEAEFEIAGIRKGYMAKYSFGVIAMAEEGAKFLILWFNTRENKRFNTLFGGIVYATYVSLGFAAFENILYVEQLGFDVALQRMYTAVPAHMFFGVLMGYYYSKWNIQKKARKLENGIVKQGIVSKPTRRIPRTLPCVFTLLMPMLAHGMYDYLAFTSDIRETGLLFLYIFLGELCIVCFIMVFKVAKKDTKDIYLADAIILKKYPNLVSSFSKKE